MRSGGDALQEFACRFVVRILRHKFAANSEVENLFVEAFRRRCKSVRCRTQRVSYLEQLLDTSNNPFLFGERRKRNRGCTKMV